MKVRFRHPSIFDVGRLYEIERLSFEHPFPQSVILSQVILHSDTSLVAVVGNKVVGYAIAAIKVLPEGRALHLLNFAVDPSYRGQGIGRLMLRVLEKLARKKGLKAIVLEVSTINYPAIRLYESEGFEKIKVLKNYYPWGEDAYLMKKELK
ncbi:30S ribosomal protein S18 [Ignicoccus pacificus DSM 13166]|uniref:30S ribosomal protein S18 n=1 Tax=Ignicoccus pacificus DSM 13166 TaxID=940294 RepID=A0A977K956_9CREN|nr:30S ribosomal protein S18 [Ignicoccus pacificus DSM 13166]